MQPNQLLSYPGSVVVDHPSRQPGLLGTSLRAPLLRAAEIMNLRSACDPFFGTPISFNVLVNQAAVRLGAVFPF